jgi:site-specific DNA-methyltransferase (adenine-specific)
MKTRSESNGSKNDNWETPEYIYIPLKKEFNFDFDPCPLNHDITKWNGLEIEWGKSNFVNPPYSFPLKDKFIEKAFNEWKKGKTCVLLIPAVTDTKSFHKFIYPYFKKGELDIRFIEKRVRFKGFNTKRIYTEKNTGQTGSMLVIMK